MTREELAAHLTRIRESKLRSEVAQLQAHRSLLKNIERMGANASSAASESAAVAEQLGDLGFLGEVRLGCIKLASAAARQMRVLGERVTRAHELTETARDTHAAIVRQKQAASELSREQDTEQFFSWKRGRGSAR
jgi:hypothetical protein